MIRKYWRYPALAFALAVLMLSFVNASWRAPSPRGYVKLIAHRGAYQQYSRAGITRDSCTAVKMNPPVHPYLENTIPGMQQAARNGAQMIELDIAPTKDGQIAIFHDWTVDCRTEGTGDTRDHTLAELKALDAGYGYTADGGKTFPFRGQGKGLIPSLEEVLIAFPEKPLLFNFKSKNPAEADQLAAALKSAGRDVEKIGDGFYGGKDEGPVARIRSHFPKAWVFSNAAAEACTKAYGWQGWLGITPETCRGGTIMVPLNYQWAFAGWPNLLIARMHEVGAKVVVLGPVDDKDHPKGLDLPEQLGEIPASFTGYVWVDDIYTIGPALRPALNRRTPPQEAALAAELERRRAVRD